MTGHLRVPRSGQHSASDAQSICVFVPFWAIYSAPKCTASVLTGLCVACGLQTRSECI